MPINTECKICGNRESNKYFRATEKMFKMGGDFTYMHCSRCACLSLLNIPEDMSVYYPPYFAFIDQQKPEGQLEKFKNIVRRSAMKGKLGSHNILDIISSKIKKSSYSWLKKDLIKIHSKILAVGCKNKYITEVFMPIK